MQRTVGLALVFALGLGCGPGTISSPAGGSGSGNGPSVPEQPHPISPQEFDDPPIAATARPSDGTTDAAINPAAVDQGRQADAAGPSADATARAPTRDAGIGSGPSGAADAGASPSVTGPCGLRISEVALYQGVKIPLARDNAAVATLNAPIIRGRPALVRAFVRPDATFGMREVELRLVLKGAAGEKAFTDRKVVSRASDETVPASTFNFTVPGEALGESASYAVEVVTPTGCGEARSPGAGEQRFETTQTGTLKVTVVPIKYDADGSGRLPDVSAAQLKRYKDYLMAMYPVSAVELSLHAPVASTIALTESSNWSLMLDQMRALRAREAPPSDVYYYGLVNPANTGPEYCKGGCVAGIAYRASAAAAPLRAGLGLGFTSGTVALETMAHELGHTHGRAHAPCGNVAGEDASFPGGKGDVGVWGYNIVTATAISPTNRKDIMGYCNPKWISDYTYAALAARGAAVNGVSVSRLELGTPAKPTERRVLLLDAAGRPSWGIPTTEPPYGAPEPARVLDAAGAVIETITVYRTEVPDLGHASILVPVPKAGWAGVLVDGAERPLSFAAPPAVPAFAQ